MKAAMLIGPGRFEVREVPDPVITQPNDVLIQIDYTGICGSDLHYFRTGKIGDQYVTFPFVMGHECTGLVRDTGRGVQDLHQGEHVIVDPAVSCNGCDQCRSGRMHTCRNLKFLGCPDQLSGGLAEYLVMPRSSCYCLPATLSLKTAVFAEPVSIALYAWQFLNKADVREIGILGVGPIGLSVLLTARDRPSVRAYVTDKVNDRLQMSKTLGAVWTANPDQVDIVSEAGVELDAVFECCGQEEALHHAVNLLKPGGHLVIVGIPEQDDIRLDPHTLRRKEIRIDNVRRQNRCMKAAIQFCAEHHSQFQALLTHTFPLNDVQQAFDIAESYQDGVIKSVISVR
ncbi:alcohol dehydrogenase catalytic domain-containing protein [bacterium]|nr:alcohol dehydrogenase catalytic domain-containing protein [bacterium]